MEMTVKGNMIAGGKAEGKILFSDEPLSFWGGYNQNTGEIIDCRHPLSGKIASHQILAIPSSKGSTTTVSVLLEAMLAGFSPAAILVQQVDAFFSLAAIVALQIFEICIPVATLSPNDFSKLQYANWLQVHPDGRIVLHMP